VCPSTARSPLRSALKRAPTELSRSCEPRRLWRSEPAPATAAAGAGLSGASAPSWRSLRRRWRRRWRRRAPSTSRRKRRSGLSLSTHRRPLPPRRLRPARPLLPVHRLLPVCPPSWHTRAASWPDYVARSLGCARRWPRRKRATRRLRATRQLRPARHLRPARQLRPVAFLLLPSLRRSRRLLRRRRQLRRRR